MAVLRIEALQRSHRIDEFDCGREGLNRFLIRHALQSRQAEASRTWVALAGDEEKAVPIMLLARLAIATGFQGRGLGSGLLKDATLRTLEAAEIAGIRAFAVHAKDDEARRFRERFDFIPSPGDPWHLFRLLKDVRAVLRPQT